tara:strand:+ start:7493 stop:8125 length:633 start_codon:yes stop_codon:yes gene_type:complete
MAQIVFQKILEQGSKTGNIARASNKAIRWFRQKAKSVRVSPKAIWAADRKRHKLSNLRRRLLGNMYMFFYDAETKDQLPYWDSFPLVIPIELTEDGFLGINFHYLDWRLRAVLMDRLGDLEREIPEAADKSEQSQKGKLDWRKIHYERLSQFARYKYFKPCLKRYKFANMKSRMIQVDRDEWDIALFLPIERFQNVRRSKVWAESRRKIR